LKNKKVQSITGRCYIFRRVPGGDRPAASPSISRPHCSLKSLKVQLSLPLNSSGRNPSARKSDLPPASPEKGNGIGIGDPWPLLDDTMPKGLGGSGGAGSGSRALCFPCAIDGSRRRGTAASLLSDCARPRNAVVTSGGLSVEIASDSDSSGTGTVGVVVPLELGLIAGEPSKAAAEDDIADTDGAGDGARGDGPRGIMCGGGEKLLKPDAVVATDKAGDGARAGGDEAGFVSGCEKPSKADLKDSDMADTDGAGGEAGGDDAGTISGWGGSVEGDIVTGTEGGDTVKGTSAGTDSSSIGDGSCRATAIPPEVGGATT
jgi:hypothetical protein